MRWNRRSPILVALMSLAAVAAPAGEAPAPPEDLKHIDAGGEALTLWPYTTRTRPSFGPPRRVGSPLDRPGAG